MGVYIYNVYMYIYIYISYYMLQNHQMLILPQIGWRNRLIIWQSDGQLLSLIVGSCWMTCTIQIWVHSNSNVYSMVVEWYVLNPMKTNVFQPEDLETLEILEQCSDPQLSSLNILGGLGQGSVHAWVQSPDQLHLSIVPSFLVAKYQAAPKQSKQVATPRNSTESVLVNI